jgi:hypothetical protein
VSLFNENWYLQNNPDVAEAVRQGLITAEQHFELYGKYENRSPSPFFDPVMYLQQNPDVAAAVQSGLINAFDHFMSYGQNESRSPSLFFDPDVYLANNPDIAAALEAGLITSAFEHFLLYGQYEPRNISPFFDLKAYLDANPDVAAAVRAGLTTAFDHFINHGFTEGRDLGNGISLAQFANDPEAQLAIRNGDVNALMDRISEVAPFLPTYEPPAGYEIPSNIPIPVDFVPVGDEKLTIPPGVEVPADLPPIFEVPGAEEPEQPGTGGGGGSGGGGGGGGGSAPTPPDPLVVAFNDASDSTALMELIRDNVQIFGDEVAEALAKLPLTGGRIDAIGNGVKEVRDLFGDFKSVGEIKEAVSWHVKTELNKKLALDGVYSTNSVAEFTSLVQQISDDRQGIIQYYGSLADASGSEAGKLRVDALEEELYTVALKGLADAFPDAADKIFSAFQGKTWEYHGSILTLVKRLYEAHANVDDKVDFMRAVNLASEEADPSSAVSAILAAIKSFDDGFADKLAAAEFPDGGGRENAVGSGVLETIKKLGVFSDVAFLREVIELHIEMEKHKAEFIRESQMPSDGPDFLDTFKDLIKTLDAERDEIIKFYQTHIDPQGSARAAELLADDYTVVLGKIMDYAESLIEEDKQPYWEKLAEAFDTLNDTYTGSVVDLIGQLNAAHESILTA